MVLDELRDPVEGETLSLDSRHQSVGKHTKIGCFPTVCVVKCKFAVMLQNQSQVALPEQEEYHAKEI